MVHPGCYIKCISDNGVACRRSRDLSDKRREKGAQKGDILVVEEVCDGWIRYKDSWLPLDIGGVPKFEMLDGADVGAGICKHGPSLWNASYTSSALLPAVEEMSRSIPPPIPHRSFEAEEASKSAPPVLRTDDPHVLTPRREWNMIRAEAELFEQDLLIRRQSSPDSKLSPSPRGRLTQQPAKLPRQLQSAPAVLQVAKTHGPHQGFASLQRNPQHRPAETSTDFHVSREDEGMPDSGSSMAVDGIVASHHDRQGVSEEAEEVLLPSTLSLEPTQAPVLEHVQEVGRDTECRATTEVSCLRNEIPTDQSLHTGEAPCTSACSSTVRMAEGADGRSTTVALPCGSIPTDDMTVPTLPSHSPHTAADGRASLHEGWVFKRSQHLGVWRRRWMVLEVSGLIRCFPDARSSGEEATSQFRIPNDAAQFHRRSDGVLELAVRYMSRKDKCLRQLGKICGLQHLGDSTTCTVLVFDAGAAGNDAWSQALASAFASSNATGPASRLRMPNSRHDANASGDSGSPQQQQQSSIPSK